MISVGLLFIVLVWQSANKIACASDSSQRFESIDSRTFDIFTPQWVELHSSWVGIDENRVYCDASKYTTTYPICVDKKLVKASYHESQLTGDDNCPAALCTSKHQTLPACSFTPFDTIDYLPPAAVTTVDNNTICSIGKGDDFISSYSDPLVSTETLGLDQGVPPHYLPITPMRMNITGQVLTMINDQCVLIENAEIVAWQLDPTKLNAFTIDSQRLYAQDGPVPIVEAYAAQTDLASPRNQSLRDLSCRARQHTDAEGRYRFFTLMPPSYGPPRHIMLQVSAPGFETLTTRMYFDVDWRLQQLTTLQGEEHSRGLYSLPIVVGFNTDRDYSDTKFPGAVAKDPRVARVRFVPSGSYDGVSSLTSGIFEAIFDIVLSPVRPAELSGAGRVVDDLETPSKVDQTIIPPVDITGYWVDPTGGLIYVETHGPSFIAHEYPHPRTWGQALGVMVGNTIRGVDFQQVWTNEDIKAAYNLFDNPQVDFKPSMSLFVSGGASTGTIITADAFATAAHSDTNPEALTIEWSGGGSSGGSLGSSGSSGSAGTNRYNSRWSRHPIAAEDARRTPGAAGFRFLKLAVTRETGGFQGGKLAINEIEFYEGVLGQEQRPLEGFKMTTPRFPPPQAVTCSTFQDQDTHCYKAFDGDRSSSSVWITKPVGSRRNVLASNQWTTIDFGIGRGVRPTAMRIVCDVQNTLDTSATTTSTSGSSGGGSDGVALGCPMTFSVLGSHDNIKFDVLFKIDMYDYHHVDDIDNDSPYGPDGKMFYFIFDTSHGRPIGQQCGSCTTGPAFTCHLDAYDGTCDSHYCDAQGRCSTPPSCPPGEYQYLSFEGYSRPAYRCRQCAAGRYGTTPSSLITSAILDREEEATNLGLGGRGGRSSSVRSTGRFGTVGAGSFCTGVCEAGYYCPAGSTSPTEFPCGDASVFCPEGSGAPIPAASGRRTVTNSTTTRIPSPDGVDDGTPVAEEAVRSFEVLCEAGHYCQAGVQYPCPVGRYGSALALQTELCTDMCTAGDYCPERSVLPTICPIGYYCPDGKERVICPAGTYGSAEGLKDRRCSGLCAPGFYCPAGSVTDTSRSCPAGRYGDVSGLADRACSGPCQRGHYCPPASASKTEVPCGGADVYCPEGSPLPIPVSLGYYTTGSASPLTRSDQTPAEKGFYATQGVKWPCRPGTFGNATSLSPDGDGNVLIVVDDTGDLDDDIIGNLTLANFSAAPTFEPTFRPTTLRPTRSPTLQPTTSHPIGQPTSMPTASPNVDIFESAQPTFAPTFDVERPRTVYLCSGYCEPGYYCPVSSNSATQRPCPAGRYGERPGLTTAECTAICPLGHYCPEASIQPIKCPPGVFGNVTGLTDAACSADCWAGGCNALQNQCEQGYYCPQGAIQGNQFPCGGSDKYCPQGSARPIPVSEGFYTIGGPRSDTSYPSDNPDHTRTAQLICEEGHYCIDGVKRPCPPGVYGASKGLTSPACTALCPAGHYCPLASTNGTSFRCPAGRYGARRGLHDSECSGECHAGFHCYEGATSPTQLECAVLARSGQYTQADRDAGIPAQAFQIAAALQVDPVSERENVYLSDVKSRLQLLPSTDVSMTVVQEPNSVYCPKGTSVPLPVRRGYYSAGGNATTRSEEVPCALGQYCADGKLFLCPAGRYGRADRLDNSDCTGPCAKGHYCPEGSTTSTEYPCPVGRYGSKEGLVGPECSGACPNPLQCVAGSTTPKG